MKVEILKFKNRTKLELVKPNYDTDIHLNLSIESSDKEHLEVSDKTTKVDLKEYAKSNIISCVVDDKVPAVNLYLKLILEIQGKIKYQDIYKGKYSNPLIMSYFNKLEQ
jgi:hypothetical protein